jgi:riboflavin kinase / FMN adenylyltransferase
MEVIRSLIQLRPHHQPCVATIGNFDGVHRGHQCVFEQLIEKAAAQGLPSVVISFEPQPQEFFARTQAPPRLTRLREKVLALRRFPIDRLLCLRFNQALASWSAADFIERVLVDGLGVRYLIVGDDFRFGCGRTGDYASLQAAGRQYGFEVANTPTFLLEGQRVSSTRVRAALNAGDMTEAVRLLGRPYTLCGRVAHGARLGRQLGFPTANIQLHRQSAPLLGVFAVQVRGLAAQPWPGVANLGMRPSVAGGEARPLLEVHLFDFNRDIYGKQLEIEFLSRLREERKFASFDALRQQIAADAAQARQVLGVS